MVKVVQQIVPEIWDLIYGRSLTESYNDGFTYYLYDYAELPAEVVRSK